MKIIAFTKENPKFKQFKHPREDSFRYYCDKERTLVIVADGITRDPTGMKELPDIEEKEKIKEVAKNYPRPSPAKMTADLFCKSFIRYAKAKKSSIDLIKNSLKEVNGKIKELNEKNNPKPDYLENDFWACVGVVGAITNNNLYYGFIADCGVAIFDKNGKLKFRTENQGPNSKGNIDKDVRKRYETSFKFPEGRKIIRSLYRNNPLNPLSYGAFTGEKNALHFIKTGKFQLNKEDYIIFYSDGMFPFLYSKKFDISKKFGSLEKYIERNVGKINGGEGTLVAIKLY